MFEANPYSLAKKSKEAFLSSSLWSLTQHHYQNSPYYKKILRHLFPTCQFTDHSDLLSIPFLPTQLFKELTLKSIKDDDIYITLRSSGTTSNKVSLIYLDQKTAQLQSSALNQILTSYIGNKRCPMIIIDSISTLKKGSSFNARAAAILGFMRFGFDHFYLLDHNMEVRVSELKTYLDQYRDQIIFIFGFTFLVWQYFFKTFSNLKIKLNIENGILIHGGGWKKLKEQTVDNEKFKKCFKEQFNMDQIYNYYGYIEQVGSIFLECEEGMLHAPIFSDIIIRDPSTFAPLTKKCPGLLQTLSILPHSYPGHSILTEDLAIWEGEDDCKCGRLGKYITVLGRHIQAEIRGCSDTYPL